MLVLLLLLRQSRCTLVLSLGESLIVNLVIDRIQHTPLRIDEVFGIVDIVQRGYCKRYAVRIVLSALDLGYNRLAPVQSLPARTIRELSIGISTPSFLNLTREALQLTLTISLCHGAKIPQVKRYFVAVVPAANDSCIFYRQRNNNTVDAG